MAGMWTTVHPSSDHDAAQHPADLVVEFDVIGDTVSLIQIASDETGEQTAVKMAIRADGREHPFHFGHELVMQARWSDLRTLEMIVKHGDAIVSSGTYTVSQDGKSLILSTTDRVAVLERVSS